MVSMITINNSNVCSPKIKHDNVAVNMLDAISNIEWSHWNDRFIAAPTLMAKTATMNEATVACTCTNAILPMIIWIISRLDDILPKLAWVDSRDARHMSKFPLRPNRAGTRINSSFTRANTFQCCRSKEKMNRIIIRFFENASQVSSSKN